MAKVREKNECFEKQIVPKLNHCRLNVRYWSNILQTVFGIFTFNQLGSLGAEDWKSLQKHIRWSWELKALQDVLKMCDPTETKGKNPQVTSEETRPKYDTNDKDNCNAFQSKGESRPVKDNVILLLEKLGLRLYYPYKISLMQAITIREFDKHKSITDIPWIFLENIIMLNSNARDSLIEQHLTCDKLQISSSNWNLSEEIDYTREHFSNEFEIVNPLDLIVSLFRCSSPILSQLVAMKMFMCRLAVPFIFPPYDHESALVFLRHLQLIIIEQKTEKGSIQSSALKCPCHVVSFVRIGELSVSKSKIANQVLSDQYHDTFFHKDCPLGTSKRQVSNGLVEAAWDLITSESRNVTMYLNLRGDGLSWQGQLEILSKISSVLVIFLNIKHLHDPKSVELLNRLQSSVAGSVLAVDASSHTNAEAMVQCRTYWKNIGDLHKKTRICKLAAEGTFESYSNIKREIKRSIIETLHNDKVLSVMTRVFEAKTILFSTDGDYPLIKRAEKRASEVLNLIPKAFLNMREQMLPLQGRLWRNLTEKQKANKQSTKYQSFYQKENIVEDMTKFRKQQLHALRKQGPMMCRFQTILMDKSLTDEECMIFITALQHALNEQSRKVIPQFLQKYQKAWQDLKVARDSNNDTQQLQKKFEDAEYNLAEASFGLEHLVRECGQGFEAVISCINQASYGMIDQVNMLSKTFARLVLQGLPLELMDGDSANVPLSWIRAVLKGVKQIIGNKNLLTVSVVGIQSSGKSTLLNTMFGLQFAVSAGRCTRGVYIQLVPVQNKKFDYLLIVDTEGLRAAKLEHQKYDQDNKLATFAIGLGDVTIVNIKGENTSEVADVLQIAVHAFLRLKLVNHNFNLEQSCVFVHQNVPATDARDKMMQGRQKFEERLNEMTKEAAKQEKITNIQRFNQVINFDSEKNVWYFSDLWVGDPPMAPTNPGYSKRASEVKEAIITRLSELRETFLTIDHTFTRIEDLWKGIMTDDFVFCFRNSLELKAYSILEKKYNELSWDLHKLFWEFSLNTAKVQLGNATEEEELQETANALTNSLTPRVSEKAKVLEDDLNAFVDKHELKEVLMQWVKTKQLKLVILTDELLTSTKSEILTLKEECKIKMLQIKEKANHEMEINRRARKLASDLEGMLVEKRVMKRQFENMWSEWFRNIKTQTIQPLDTQSVTDKIKNTVWDMCPSINNYLNNQEMSTTLRRLRGCLTPQNFEIGKHFEIHRRLDQNTPMHPGFYRQCLTEITDVIFNKILLKVSEIERQDVKFNTKFVVDILHIIEEDIESHNNQNQSQSFTFNLLPLYNALIISHVVRYITGVFTKHEEAYQKRHSIMGQLEEYKDTAWGLFISAVNKTTEDITAAKCFIKVINSLVIEQIRYLTPNDIKDTIVNKFAHAKETIVYEIMKDLASKENFEDIYFYILDPCSFAEKWLIDHAISIYFEKGDDGQHQYARIAEGYVRKIFVEIRKGIKEATDTTCRGTIASWIKNFCENIHSLPTNKFHFVSITDMVDVDVVHFVKLISDRSDKMEKGVLELIIQTNKNNIVWPHHPIRDIMDSLWGCKSKCPFCFEPCINTNQNHNEMGRDHRCLQHRIQGLKGVKWSTTRKLALEFCNILVQADRVSFGSRKKKEWTKCIDYKAVHPAWDIEPTSDTSDYWKWIVCRFKESFEKKYGKEFDEIPSSWKNISKEDAIASLDMNLSDSS